MAEIEGLTVLCPGCPNTGNYIGELKPEVFEFYPTKPGDSLSAFHQSAIAVAVDEYDMKTRPVYSSSFPRLETEEKIESLKNGAAVSICDRVRRCVGTTAVVRGTGDSLRTEFDCPAFNRDVMNKLTQEG